MECMLPCTIATFALRSAPARINSASFGPSFSLAAISRSKSTGATPAAQTQPMSVTCTLRSRLATAHSGQVRVKGNIVTTYSSRPKVFTQQVTTRLWGLLLSISSKRSYVPCPTRKDDHTALSQSRISAALQMAHSLPVW